MIESFIKRWLNSLTKSDFQKGTDWGTVNVKIKIDNVLKKTKKTLY